jgi:predicted MFS family arabinose efflux permease
MNSASPSALREWASNWTLVLSSAVGFSFFSVMIATTGLFMEPVTEAFDWSRTLYSSGVSIATFTTAILSPFFGALIDRLGSRRLALPGVLLTTASMMAFGFVSGVAWQWMLLWLVFGLVSVSIKSTIWTAAVLGVFDRSKGLALGLTMAGTALSQVLVPPVGNWLIGEFGWRAAYVWLGLGWGGLTFLLTLLFFFDVHDVAAGKRAKDRPQQAVPVKVDLPGLTVREAVRDWALWRVGLSNFVIMVLTMGLMMHLIPILTEAGISRTSAALLSSLGGIAGIVGKLLTGVLLDRFRPNWIGGLTLGAAAITFALLMEGIRSPALIVFALIVNGYAAGTKTQITGFLTASYGGMKSFGAVYGTMAALMAAASGVGPLLAGAIYDTYGGYEPFLLAGAVGCALGGFVIMTLPRYPEWERKENKPEAAFA